MHPLLTNSLPPLDGSSGSIWAMADVEARRRTMTMMIPFDVIVPIFKVNPPSVIFSKNAYNKVTLSRGIFQCFKVSEYNQ
jgi:hypothetical protein